MPEQNGVAERYNCMIVEMARIMMDHARLLHIYWAEVVNTVIYIQNQCLTNTLDNDSIPSKLWMGKKVNVHHF